VIRDTCKGEGACELDPSALDFGTKNLHACVDGVPNTLTVEVTCTPQGGNVLLGIAFMFVLMGSLGMTVEAASFIAAAQERKRGVLVGFASQYGLMPLVTFIMAKAGNWDMVVAVGAVLIACAPGGTTSNLFTYLSGGELELSVIMTVMSTIGAVFMLPLLIHIYINAGLGATEEFAIPFMTIISTLILIVFPFGLGMLGRKLCICKCGKLLLHEIVSKFLVLIGVVILFFFLLQL